MAARKLGVSVKTVENHRCSIMRKLDAPNMTAAIDIGGKCGLL
jgi:DNA-binding NarL/FixJ family response regulator